MSHFHCGSGTFDFLVVLVRPKGNQRVLKICNGNAGMPLTASEVAAFKATDKRQNKSCGDSLVLVVEPISKGGGKPLLVSPAFRPEVPRTAASVWRFVGI